jgi:hypothetical protein
VGVHEIVSLPDPPNPGYKTSESSAAIDYSVPVNMGHSIQEITLKNNIPLNLTLIHKSLMKSMSLEEPKEGWCHTDTLKGTVNPAGDKVDPSHTHRQVNSSIECK